jgi:hypothetical protein
LTDEQIDQIGGDLNGWKGVKLKPSEVVACSTVKDIIDLIYGKLKGKSKS